MSIEKRSIFISFTAVLLLFSSTSRSAEFCSKPFEVVCSDKKEIETERKKRLEKLSQKILSDADEIYREMDKKKGCDFTSLYGTKDKNEEKNGPKTLGSFVGRVGEVVSIPAKTLEKAVGDPISLIECSDSFFQMNQAINQAAVKNIQGYESNIVSKELIAKAKTLLIQSIDESSFSSKTKSKFKKIVKETVVGTFEDYNKRHSGLIGNLMKAFLNFCGHNGLSTNAFATSYEATNYVLICPGWLISANTPKTQFEKDSLVLKVLSHELAHHIDAKDYPKEYERISSCYENNMVGYLNKSDEDKRFCDRSGSAECAKKVVKSHIGEITADHWAAKVVHKYMSEESLASTDAVSLIKDGLKNLCDSKDEGIHASGHFRITNIFGYDTNIREYLGCSHRYMPIKHCDFEGLTFSTEEAFKDLLK